MDFFMRGRISCVHKVEDVCVMDRLRTKTSILLGVFCLAVFSGGVFGQRKTTTVLVASPMQSRTPSLRFPLVSGLPDVDVQRQVNQVLADREKQDLQRLRDCTDVLHYQSPGAKDEDSETMSVTYLSPHFLSVDARVTVWQCAPYPQLDIPEPLTVDLRTGREVDWKKFFVDGFLPVPDYSVRRKPQTVPTAKLTLMYLSRYKQTDPQCVSAVKDDISYGYDLWFDRRRKALVVVPDFPHVIRACADEIAIPLSEILPYIADEATARELSK
jgi:hypothetical protein